jgi:acetyl/propionyl-CoA carboxylase alpha subunit
MRYIVTIGGEELEVSLAGPVARVGDAEFEAHLVELEGTPVWLATIAGRVYRILARPGVGPDRYTLHIGGYRFDVEALDERTRAIQHLSGAAAHPSGPTPLVAPMPGLVVRVLVKPGDRVQAHQGLVVIEAMKMENELRARAAGVVRGVAVSPGSAVEKGALLVEFDAPTDWR